MNGRGWSPKKLDGCVLWIRASAGVSLSGSDITGIADQSGRGNDVVANGTPQLVSNAIGTMPGIALAGADGRYLKNASVQLVGANAARHAFGVGKGVAGAGGSYTAGGGSFLSTSTSTSTSVGRWSFLTSRVTESSVYGDTQAGNVTTNPAEVLNGLSMVADLAYIGGTGDNKLTYNLNGTQKTLTLNANAYTEPNTPGFTVGADANYPAYRWAGYLCEVLLFNRVLSTIEADTVRRYFGAIYGITIP
jgi:hypothetical protein